MYSLQLTHSESVAGAEVRYEHWAALKEEYEKKEMYNKAAFQWKADHLQTCAFTHALISCFWLFDLELDPMTLIHEHDIDILNTQTRQ